jgi:ABC-type nitrate/sulfonate/bicarbonate transport system substrate-binding protein
MVIKLMFMKRGVIFLVLFALLLNSCKYFDKKRDNETAMKASLIQEWFPYSGYAGEVMAVYETAKENGIILTIKQGSDNIDPLKLVISGESDFGVASADRILQANEMGADLVIIGVLNYKSPTCFLSKKDKNIMTPNDFEGKIVGILTGTNTELIYKILKNNASINVQKVKDVEIPFDLGTFISGSYDIRPAFIYDETVSLDLQNIEYNILKPEDFGVDFIGTVYFTKRSTIEKNSELVRAFVQSMKEGWKLATENPAKAIDYLKQYDSNIDAKRELLSLQKAITYFEGENGQILYASKRRWEHMASDLIKIGFIKNFDFNRIVNYSFLDIK